ncbi:MAG: hypothetical protein WKF33_05070 [Thermoleophilaceae bacterium]|nr:hypothetical protein [Actinomycetota bacterium]
MSASGLGRRRAGGERLAAWLLTGPLGHLFGFLADAAVLWAAWARREARRQRARARAARGTGGMS